MLYKYEYQGEAEKDGQVYKKYKRLKRFPDLWKYVLRLVVILVLIGIVAMVTNQYYNSAVYKNLKRYKQ